MSGTQWWHCVHCEMLVPSSAACLPPHPPSPPVRIAATSSEVGDVGGEVPHRTGCPDGSPGLLENQLPPKSFRQKAAPPPHAGCHLSSPSARPRPGPGLLEPHSAPAAPPARPESVRGQGSAVVSKQTRRLEPLSVSHLKGGRRQPAALLPRTRHSQAMY